MLSRPLPLWKAVRDPPCHAPRGCLIVHAPAYGSYRIVYVVTTPSRSTVILENISIARRALVLYLYPTDKRGTFHLQWRGFLHIFCGALLLADGLEAHALLAFKVFHTYERRAEWRWPRMACPSPAVT